MATIKQIIKQINISSVKYDIAAKYDSNERNIADTYITKTNPTGTGSLSLNRKANTTVGDCSIAIGESCEASGRASHAEGEATMAYGDSAHAEGSSTQANGDYSHAEGSVTTASGNSSHAQGGSTTASGWYSHAEGYGTTASGNDSHAEGLRTIAAGEEQHVQGKYNIEDTSNKYAHIVGNGNSITRSNAHTLDWNGNAWFKGNIYLGGTDQDGAVSIFEMIYPVGSIYMSTSSKNPSSYFGGTWVAWGEGRVPVGVGSSDRDFAANETGGHSTHRLVQDEMPKHIHSISVTAANNGGHTHTVSGTAASSGAHTHSVSGTAASNGAHTHVAAYKRKDNYGDGALDGIHWSNYKDGSFNTGSAGAHTHSVSGTAASKGAHTHSVSGTAASNGAHIHSVSGTTESQGNGDAHNNLQPYITCYMWKRTA